MKYLYTALVLYAFLYNISAQVPVESAEQAYLQADYALAISYYQQFLENNPSNTSVLFNIGQSFFQLQQHGKALAYYLRAHATAPRDTDIQLALIRVYTKTQQNIEESNLFFQAIKFTKTTLSKSEWWVVLTITWSILFATIHRKALSRGFRLSLTTLFLLLFILYVGQEVTDHLFPVVAITQDTSAYTGAGSEFFNIFSLVDGIQARLLESKEDWSKVLLPDGRSGWITTESFIQINHGG